MIDIKEVTKIFGSQKILDNVSLNVKAGEKIAILGQNGAGKSSLMRIILGEFVPNSGNVSINGVNTLKDRKEALKFISFVPQTPPPLKFSLRELCEFVCKSSNVKFEDIEKFSKLLELDLHANLNKSFYKLSGGMKQKMLIAIAFAKDSEILMFDEPTANLDFGNQMRVLKEIKKLAKQGYIIILTSHQPEQVFYLNAKVAMLGRDKNYIYGEASEAMSSENLKKIYGVDIRVVKNIIDEHEHYSCVMVD